jgi:preprotein translocase subunit SecA
VPEDFAEAATAGQVTESVITEALELYAERDETIPGGAETARQLERDIMLQIMDQRWQDHLADMDYLKEGINLRAMGNQDPLVAWQREGFAMFGKLMDGINDDYLRYVFHVQVLAEENAAEPDLAQANYVAADDPVQGDAAFSAAYAAATPAEIEAAAAVASGIGASTAGHTFDDGETQAPIVKSDREKIGRNEPCWCDSGKKYKLCHGAN